MHGNYTNISICTYIHIYTRTHACSGPSPPSSIYIYVCMYVCMYIWICWCSFTQTHACRGPSPQSTHATAMPCVKLDQHIHMYTYIMSLYVCERTFATQGISIAGVLAGEGPLHACVCVKLDQHIHMYTHTHIRKLLCVNVPLRHKASQSQACLLEKDLCMHVFV